MFSGRIEVNEFTLIRIKLMPNLLAIRIVLKSLIPRKRKSLISFFLVPILQEWLCFNYFMPLCDAVETIMTQPAFNCSKLTKEALEQGVKCVRS